MARRQSFDKVGVVYIKQYNARAVAADGLEKFAAGKMIPPYVQPREIWVGCRLVGGGTSVAPTKGLWYNFRAGLVETNLNQQQVETDDVTGDEFIGRYFDQDAARFDDESDTPQSDVGIPHDNVQRNAWWKRREIFNRRTFIGLPDKAVFTDADLITLVDKFKFHRKITSRIPIDAPKFIACAYNQDEPTSQVDWGDVLWGDNNDHGELINEIVDHLGAYQASGQAVDDLVDDSPVTKWLGEGFIEANVDLGMVTTIRTTMTVKCDVYTPRSARILSPF